MSLKKMLLAMATAGSLMFSAPSVVFAQSNTEVAEASDGSVVVTLLDGTKVTLPSGIASVVADAIATGNLTIIQAAVAQAISLIVANNGGGVQGGPSVAEVERIEALTVAVTVFAVWKAETIFGAGSDTSSAIASTVVSTVTATITAALPERGNAVAAINDAVITAAAAPVLTAEAPAGGPGEPSLVNTTPVTLDAVQQAAAAVSAAIREATVEAPVVSPNSPAT